MSARRKVTAIGSALAPGILGGFIGLGVVTQQWPVVACAVVGLLLLLVRTEHTFNEATDLLNDAFERKG